MTCKMRAYGDTNQTSGITGYAIDTDDNSIEIEFTSGGVYTYRKENVGEVEFAVIQALAIAGSGLNTYINKNVRGRGLRRAQPPYSRAFTVTTDCPKTAEILSEVLTQMGVYYSVS